ncbi:MAG: PKD domain-containing protein [Chloroflexota bacterium]|nr:MAG: PKD domain-containing protein [Chloroflexota bacterium]
MKISGNAFGVALVLLAVVAMLGVACGQQPPPVTSPTPSGNQLPEISSLTANPPGVSYGGSTTIKCIASDPNGDAVTYSWSASGGNISGSGDTVTWIAPNQSGNYDIMVAVSDDKGGETTGSVMVVVSAAGGTITFTPVTEETGTVGSDGDRDTSRTIAGDDDQDIGYHAFWSFDISSLAGKKIQNATLRLTTKNIVGDPFSSVTGLGGLRFWRVTYSDKLPQFAYIGTNLITVPLYSKPPTTIEVTQDVINATVAASPRFQVEALFQHKVTDGDLTAEFIEWSEVVLEVTYSEK